jgi:hypothetical protein
VTDVVPIKLVPVIVTVSPPAVLPLPGETEVTAGAGGREYVNWSEDTIAEVPEGVVTVILTVPGPAAGGELTVIWVSEIESMAANVVPNDTCVAPPVKFDPLMVTEVPPAVLPQPGETRVTDGGVPVAHAAGTKSRRRRRIHAQENLPVILATLPRRGIPVG